MPEILIQGREAAPDERTRSSMSLQKLATQYGWQVKIGYSQFQDDPRTYKTGAKAGKTEPGKIIENVWCQGWREGKVFTVVWHSNKLDHCLYGNELVSLKQLKEILCQ